MRPILLDPHDVHRRRLKRRRPLAAGGFESVDFGDANPGRASAAGRTYGGGGYWINPGAANKNYWFAGWLLQRQVTQRLALGGEVFHQTADTDGGPDSNGFNLGGIYDIDDNNHILFSAGRGVQHAAATDRFSYYVAYQLTF